MKQKNEKHRLESILLCFLLLVVLITVISMFLFRRTISEATELGELEDVEGKKHYAFICDDYANPMIQQIFQYIRKEGEKANVYVEYFGKQLSIDYTAAELLEIATNARIDGIFIVGDESNEMKEGINHAVSNNIPVVTVFQDCSRSKRQCFVGVNGYDLGQLYAKKLFSLKDATTRNVYILETAKQDQAGEDSVFSSMSTYLRKQNKEKDISLHKITIKSKTEFSSDELIRDLILNKEKKPDVLICLSNIDTVCAYQAVVDYNMVGKIEILGWGSTAPILTAIEKQIVEGAVSINPSEIGELSMKAMLEYERTGQKNPHLAVTASMIDPNTLADYQ